MTSPARLACLLCAFGLAAAAAPPVFAQETITPDRPGIGSGATVVSPGIFQLESGVGYAGADGVDVLSVGQLFLRYGVGGAVEFELLANSFVSRSIEAGGATVDEDGVEDLGVGAKVRVATGERATFSLQGIVTAATGSAAFTSDQWYGTLNGLLDVGLSERAGVGVNLGVRPAVGDLATVVAASVTPGVALDGGFGVYGGWAGTFVSGGDVNFVEAGGTFLADTDVQLDVNGAWAVDTDDWFIGAGFAIRWGAGG